MRIGMISQWYEPETGAAAHPTAIARALQRRGHQLRVLTGFPNYPHGKVHPGYRMRLRQHERVTASSSCGCRCTPATTRRGCAGPSC